jgi:hypothetical protein
VTRQKKQQYRAPTTYRERQRTHWRAQGGHARARRLSPETRSEIARKGYQSMMEQRYIQVLELALFGLDTRELDKQAAP